MRGVNAIVTGGGGGIGRAIVDAFWERGANVAVFDLARTDAPSLLNSGQAFLSLTVDVASFSAVDGAVAQVVEDFGRVDILVNCAGINRDRVVWKMTEDEWDQVIAVDLKSCFNTARAVAGRFKEQKSGRIVNISSINGLRGKFGQVNYSAAKAGVIGMTKALAKELGAFGVTCNVVCPGLVMTDMVRAAPAAIIEQALEEMVIKELPTPEDVAGAVLFFVSDAARRVTGEVIRVDSGQYI
jgi:3-oxoacyl-[acyl-carrier protein] reductase